MTNIFLCGFMGAGKTTVGKVLAKKMGRRFIDLDHYIEQQAGCSIPQIFEQHGETEFRKKEREAIGHFIESENYVVALGGGALQNQILTDKIKTQTLLIFIDCPVSVVLGRLRYSRKRPLLLNADGSRKEAGQLMQEITELYKKRLPLYSQAAIIIDSSRFASPYKAALHLKAITKKYEH